MRKRLYKFYNILSSYPVLVLLICGITAMLYVGSQYKPLELMQTSKLEAKMQLKQKRQSIEKDLVDVEMVDLEKRYALFNQNFLKLSELEDGTLYKAKKSILGAYSWDLELMKKVFIDDSVGKKKNDIFEGSALISGVTLKLSAISLPNIEKNGDPFLPLFSATEAMKYMWSRPPYREYQRVKLSRLEEGYHLESSIFMPLRNTKAVVNLEENEI